MQREVSCACLASGQTCSCNARASIETTVVAHGQPTETLKEETKNMSGDVSSTDVVSSGFGGPWGGFNGSLRPAEVALVSANNPFNPTNFLRDAITAESLRAEIKGIDAKVTAVTTQLAVSEARHMQQEIDQLQADKTNGLLAQILAAVTKSSNA
jgi:hypothetical protein